MLKEIIENYKYTYIPVEDFSYNKILNLFTKNEIFEPETSNEFLYLGLFYVNIKKDYNKAEEYYIKASDLGHVVAMNNLGYLYYNNKKDYNKAKEYYIKAASMGRPASMTNLAFLYENLHKDYDNAYYYYKLAFNKGQSHCFTRIINILKKQSKYEKAFLFAHKHNENGYVSAFLNKLPFPIQDKYKVKIYQIIETFDFDTQDKLSINVGKILQDTISIKYKTLCQISYHYKHFHQK